MKHLSSKDLAFIKKHFQASQVPNLVYSLNHARATAEALETANKKYREIKDREIKAITLAALGHDLLEDTPVTKIQIKNIWGLKTLKYIESLTNTLGDSNFSPYLKKLTKLPEENLIIKLADIYANGQNSVKQFRSLDKKWLKTFWLPLLLRYKKLLFNKKFKKYPQIAHFLIIGIEQSILDLNALLYH